MAPPLLLLGPQLCGLFYIAQIPLGWSRHVSTRHDTFDVSSVSSASWWTCRAVLSDNRDTAEMHGPARQRVVSCRDEPSEIWAYIVSRGCCRCSFSVLRETVKCKNGHRLCAVCSRVWKNECHERGDVQVTCPFCRVAGSFKKAPEVDTELHDLVHIPTNHVTFVSCPLSISISSIISFILTLFLFLFPFKSHCVWLRRERSQDRTRAADS